MRNKPTWARHAAVLRQRGVTLKGRPQEQRVQVGARQRLQRLVHRLVGGRGAAGHVAHAQLRQLQHRLRVAGASLRDLQAILPQILFWCVSVDAIVLEEIRAASGPDQRIGLGRHVQDAILQRGGVAVLRRHRLQLPHALLPEPLQLCCHRQSMPSAPLWSVAHCATSTRVTTSMVPELWQQASVQ